MITPSPLNDIENDIMLYSSSVNVVPAFIAMIVATLILMVFLIRANLLRRKNIMILLASFLASSIGCTGYDTFLIRLYRRNYQINLNTLSGVCMLIAVFSFIILANQLIALEIDKQERKDKEEMYREKDHVKTHIV